jgi:hypothetical protein
MTFLSLSNLKNINLSRQLLPIKSHKKIEIIE